MASIGTLMMVCGSPVVPIYAFPRRQIGKKGALRYGSFIVSQKTCCGLPSRLLVVGGMLPGLRSDPECRTRVVLPRTQLNIDPDR